MKSMLIIITLLVAMLVSGCNTQYSYCSEREEYHKKCIVEIEQSLIISKVLDSGILFGWKIGE